MKRYLILLRHGQSTWNLENRFTGWVDVDLSELGRREAQAAGQLLKAEGIRIDQAYTSVLKRAIRTLWIALDELDLMWLPVERHWRLNERHYGGLQGLNKAETVARHGEAQVLAWRRGYAIAPPLQSMDDPDHPSKDRRYADLRAVELPSGESLKMTLDRVLPYWQTTLLPKLESGKNLLVAAHGNSLRALIKHLEGISDDDIVELNVPTGIPRVYEFDDKLNILQKRYLGDQAAAEAAAAAVAKQTQAAGKK